MGRSSIGGLANELRAFIILDHTMKMKVFDTGGRSGKVNFPAVRRGSGMQQLKNAVVASRRRHIFSNIDPISLSHAGNESPPKKRFDFYAGPPESRRP